MIATLAATSALDMTLAILPVQIFSHRAAERISAERQPNRKINRLLKWRQQNPGLFESLRVAGMKRSLKVRANIERIHRECKAQWRASALANPKLRATELHIAAKAWTLLAPNGQRFEVRNLKKFVRDNEHLFAPEDIEWKMQGGQSSQTWCRAFQALSRLRPTCSKRLDEWQGWKWAE